MRFRAGGVGMGRRMAGRSGRKGGRKRKGGFAANPVPRVIRVIGGGGSFQRNPSVFLFDEFVVTEGN